MKAFSHYSLPKIFFQMTSAGVCPGVFALFLRGGVRHTYSPLNPTDEFLGGE